MEQCNRFAECAISIHALREESDFFSQVECILFDISIHALREESDLFFSS